MTSSMVSSRNGRWRRKRSAESRISRSASAGLRRRRRAVCSAIGWALDQLYPVTIGIADEADERRARANAIRRFLRLDSLRGQLGQDFLEAIHADGYVV